MDYKYLMPLFFDTGHMTLNRRLSITYYLSIRIYRFPLNLYGRITIFHNFNDDRIVRSSNTNGYSIRSRRDRNQSSSQYQNKWSIQQPFI